MEQAEKDALKDLRVRADRGEVFDATRLARYNDLLAQADREKSSSDQPVTAGIVEQLATLIASEGTKTRDSLTAVLAPFNKKISSIIGSELGVSEVNFFNKSDLPAAEFPDYVSTISPDSEACRFVYKKVWEYTADMADNAKLRRVNEEIYIQQPTFELFRSLVANFIHGYEMQFFEKGSGGAVQIGYTTKLVAPNGVVVVRGQTDQLIALGGIPMGNVEVKNLDKTLDTPKEVGEILSGDKGFAEVHRKRVGAEPRLFPSVLVSGRRWVFVDRSFRDGERYMLFPALVTFSVDNEGENVVCKIDEAGVLMVSRMLIRMITAIEKLIKATRSKRKRSFDVCNASEGTEEGSDESSEKTSDQEDTQGPLNTGPSAPEEVRTATAPASSSKRPKGGGGGGGGGGAKGAQSNLTLGNMYRHDMDTMWHRHAAEL